MEEGPGGFPEITAALTVTAYVYSTTPPAAAPTTPPTDTTQTGATDTTATTTAPTATTPAPEGEITP
jgi:hypothetical protein